MKRFTCSLALLLLTSACSSLLPKAQTESTSFRNFDEARAAIEGLVPMKSDRKTLGPFQDVGPSLLANH
ncbi:MAG: hypothetical protein PHS32_22645 [Rhodoferax sp.]|uniref:hypothetical protein n=1 Tax=Rhodoferax sp. TaxID=50421 RepID=UPI00260A1275|nr:hypothetical protein [Rhodoferax sp.]MDD5336547.1 hypothetical protein [Rhodoferax sp.]